MSTLLRNSSFTSAVRGNLVRSLLMIALLPGAARAQEKQVVAPATNAVYADLSEQVRELRTLVEQLQRQVGDLQARVPAAQTTETVASRPAAAVLGQSQAVPQVQIPPQTQAPPQTASLSPIQPQAQAVPPAQSQAQPAQASVQSGGAAAKPTPTEPAGYDFLRGTTVNVLMDGYYEYNFDSPIGRANLLRAYDVSSNAFSLNQADLVLENAADPANGKRFGARLDLQYGQATETLQGNPANEPRPDVYRAVFQAYGTYVAPIGRGLTLDFGKWASSIGLEGNYTKDQMNYSRSFWFDFLPFYHMGLRANYQVNDQLSVNYWMVNGANQTEPVNGYKDELVGVNLTPTKNINWTVNYYLGQEHPDFQYEPVGTPGLPEQQGNPFEPIANPAKGKLHIFDSYVTWNASPKLSFALEGDYVIERLQIYSQPVTTDGGAAYVRYQLLPKVAIAARSEYLADGGLFSGKPQALKEGTVTFEYKFKDNFLMKEEWRRDFSNQPFFLTDTLNILSKEQTTLGVGLVWWFGGKQGIW
jgi:Putative beta-barrel porin-2, OmpL-like. bbp2